ncbi:MAG: hypothetical protein ACP5O2_06630 [Bacteroidales bacterium]
MKIRILTGILVLFFFRLTLVDGQEVLKPVVQRQFYNPQVYISKLPREVRETSGLIWFNDLFWTHNDSGGQPEIYGLDPHTGKLKVTVVITNAKNVDWEDIAQDDQYIYVGDFGNNRGTRHDLCIYKIPKQFVPNRGSAHVQAEKITFRWEKQTDFPEVADRNTNFDCEAMIALYDRLILFTKNWGNQHSAIYSLPKTPGDYTATFLMEWEANGLITGADYDESRHTLALVGYKNYTPFLWLIEDFNTVDVAGWKALRLELDDRGGSQTEGICFAPDHFLYVSTEETSLYAPLIFRIDFESLISKLPLKGEDMFEYQYNISDGQLRLMVKCKTGEKYKVTVQNRKGQVVAQWKLKPGNEPAVLTTPIANARNMILKLESGRYMSTVVLQNP